MKVFCAYSNLHPLTKQALEGVAEFVHTPGEFGYYEFMLERWRAKESFILVEGDIVPWPNFQESLEACDEPYCGYPYRIFYFLSAHWGCSKFAASLMELYPNVIEEAGKRSAHQKPWIADGRHWNSLDTRFAEAMMIAQGSNSLFLPHTHNPPVMHMHEYAPQDRRKTCVDCEAKLVHESLHMYEPLTEDHGGFCDDCYRSLFVRNT